MRSTHRILDTRLGPRFTGSRTRGREACRGRCLCMLAARPGRTPPGTLASRVRLPQTRPSAPYLIPLSHWHPPPPRVASLSALNAGDRASLRRRSLLSIRIRPRAGARPLLRSHDGGSARLAWGSDGGVAQRRVALGSTGVANGDGVTAGGSSPTACTYAVVCLAGGAFGTFRGEGISGVGAVGVGEPLQRAFQNSRSD